MPSNPNKFNYEDHIERGGEPFKQNMQRIHNEQTQKAWEESGKDRPEGCQLCPTFTMTHSDGRQVVVNAHAKDDQAVYVRKGFKLPAEAVKIDPKDAEISDLKKTVAELAKTVAELKKK